VTMFYSLRSSSVPPTLAPSGPVVCLAVKPAGKLDAGNRHVRFDGPGWETGHSPKGPGYRAHPQLYLRVELQRPRCRRVLGADRTSSRSYPIDANDLKRE
jgi:hypothetical protein